MSILTSTTGSDSFFSLDKMREILLTFEPAPQQSLLVSLGMKQEMIKAAYQLEPSLMPRPEAALISRFMGLPVHTFDIPPEEVFDWSGCRSPSRAKRRHARGIPQRVKITYRERAYLIDQRVLSDFARRFERVAMAALYGGTP